MEAEIIGIFVGMLCLPETYKRETKSSVEIYWLDTGSVRTMANILSVTCLFYVGNRAANCALVFSCTAIVNVNLAGQYPTYAIASVWHHP